MAIGHLDGSLCGSTPPIESKLLNPKIGWRNTKKDKKGPLPSPGYTPLPPKMMMWWTIKLLGILRYPIFKTNPFGGGSWPIMTSTWRSFTSYKYGVHHASLVHRSPPGPHALRVALLLGKTTAATRAPRLNLGQRPAERRQKIWSAMLYYPILFIKYVWECLRCFKWRLFGNHLKQIRDMDQLGNQPVKELPAWNGSKWDKQSTV